MTELPLTDWGNFFVASASAAAALAGLLFVAVSINLTRILQFAPLPLRAGETLMTFAAALVVSTFGLVPHQTAWAFGLEAGGSGVCAWVFQTWALARTWDNRKGPFIVRVLNNQLPPVPFIAGGAWLMLGHASGLDWLVPGVLLSFGSGLFGAWVLLVEIQR